MFNAKLLTSTSVQDFIKNAIKKKMDVLQISTALNKAKFTNDERIAIMDYMALIPKFREKFFKNEINCNEIFLLCDKLALEQSTAQDIGRWKSTLWPKISKKQSVIVHDLCCGMGGDSFFLPKEFNVVGIDLDEARLAMYQHNVDIFRNILSNENNAFIKTILGDVRKNAKLEQADYFTIDPARRSIDGENQRDLRNLTPTFEEIIEISKHYKGGMAKLPPGYPTAEIPDNTELIYIGGHSDCRELLVLFGDLAKNSGKVRSVIVDKFGNCVSEWIGNLNEIQVKSNKDAEKNLPGHMRSFRNATSESDLPVGKISKYLLEPTAVLIRSHLFGKIALTIDSNAHLISEGIAYVASDKILPTPAFTCFEVIDKSEMSTSAIRTMLKTHDIGKLTLKLRGVKIDPDAEIKRLKPKGKKKAILFYTRAKGEKIAILAIESIE